MEIYNYHSDLLVSLRFFFDNFIFPPDTIKGYQFNIGDRALQIKNDPKFELPRIIINYNSNQAFNYHPYTWTRTQVNNAPIPILYNRTKNLTLEVHEELFEFQVAVIINCESQLSALTIEHILQNKLILNKYFSLYEYHSFVEIDSQFLTPQMFDINNDDILNLFVKYNSVRSLTEYCYSIKYSPLIKMTSIDIAMGSTDQHSFSITLALSIFNHIPVYHDIPSYEKRNTSVKTILCKDIIIPKDYPLFFIEFTDLNNVVRKTPIFCKYDIITGDFNSSFKISDINTRDDYIQSGVISGNIKSIEYIGIYICNIDLNTIRSNCVLTYDIKTKLYIAKLSSGLTGTIPNIKIDNLNKFGGMFLGVLNSNIQKFKIFGTFEIEHQYYVLNNSKLDYIESSIPIIKYNIVPISVGKLYYNFKDVDPKFVSINLKNTSFKKINFIYNNVIYDYNISEYTLDDNGEFLITINIFDINLIGTINGSLNIKTFEFNFYTSLDIQILFLVCDFELKSSVGYGALYINRINISINPSYDPVVIDSTCFSFYNESLKPNNIRKLYRSVLLLFSNFDIIFKFEDPFVIITIVLDPSFIMPDKVYWIFYNKFMKCDSLSSEIYILEKEPQDLSNILKFKCSREVYDFYFLYLDIDNPIIFQIFKEI